MTRAAPAIVVACVAILALPQLGLAGEADADDAPGADALASYVNDRIAERERAIDRLTHTPQPRSKSDRFVHSARAAMHQLLRELWLTTQRSIRGRHDAEAGGVAAHAAIALEQDLDRFEQAVVALPGDVRRAVRSEGSDSAAFKRLSSTVEAVKAFTSVVERRGDAPALDAPSAIDDLLGRAIDDLLGRAIGPLVDAELLNPDPHERADWFGHGAVAAADATIDAETLASVRQRLEEAGLDRAARRRADWLLRMIERAADQPRLRPHAAATLARLQAIGESRAMLRRADWLGAGVLDVVDARAREAIVGLAESTDDADVPTARRLRRAATIADRIASLTSLDAEVMGRLRAAFESALRAELGEAGGGAEARTSRLALLDALTATMAEADASPPRKLPTMLLRARNAFERQYRALAETLITDLAAADRAAIHPALRHQLARLRELRARVRRLDAAPAWVDRMAQLNRHARSGFRQQLHRLAEDMLDPETDAAAGAAMAELEAKLAWAHKLPHESMLDPGAAEADGWPTPMQAERLRHRLTVARSRWAAAWSAGVDPSEPGDRLSMLRRLLIAGHRARAIRRAPVEYPRLGRWAGWHVRPAALAGMRDRLDTPLKRATDAAAENNWGEAKQHLRSLERVLAAPWLAHRLMSRLRPLIDAPDPDAGSALHFQSLTPPSRAFLASERSALGWLALTVNARHELGDGIDAAEREDLLRRAAELADRIHDRLDGSPESQPKAERRAAPVSAIDL